MAGLDSAGFTPKTLEEIKEDIETSLKASFGPQINLLATSVFGQLVGLLSNLNAEEWEVLEEVYNSQYPDTASGVALDNVCAITGVTRLPATKSTVLLTVDLDAATTLPAGRVVSVADSPASRFVTTEEVTSGGAGTYFVEAEAEVTGPVVGNTGTITVIETPVAGWNSVTNSADAEIGREIETDEDLRLRRESLLRVTGSATAEAIRSDILDIEDVQACFVFENTSSVTDGDGVPGKAFEAVVLGGDDSLIAEAIWASKPAGIESYGSVQVGITDSQGFGHTMEFSRPTDKAVHVIVDVLTDDEFPDDGDTQIKEKVAAYGDSLTIGDDVVVSQVYAHIFEVSGVVDVTSIKVGFSDPPTLSANLSIGSREIAVFDTSDVDVNVT